MFLFVGENAMEFFITGGIVLFLLIMLVLFKLSVIQNDASVSKKELGKTMEIETILKMKNKDFVFKCLLILEESGREEDVDKLTEIDYCKNKFGMHFPVLQQVQLPIKDESIFRDNCGYRRYYPNVIKLFDKDYIVCNDWFYDNKVNTRDTRTPFINWIMK